MSAVKALLACYKPYRGILVLVIVGAMITSGLEITFPMIVRYILGEILPAMDIEALLKAVGLLFALYVLCLLVGFIVSYKGRGMGSDIENDLRRRLFRHMESLSFHYFDNAKVGQLLSRIISDISQVGGLTFQLPNLLVVCVITLIGSALCLFYINKELGAIVIFLVALKALYVIYLNGKMKRAFKAARQLIGEVSAKASESLNAIRLVQSFVNEELELKKFTKASRAFQSVQKKSFLYESELFSSVTFFTNITNLAIMGVGAYFIMRGSMQLSDLVAFQMYLMLFMRPLQQLAMLTERWQHGMAGFGRYLELMEEIPDIRDSKNAVAISYVRGEIEFREVDFAYAGTSHVLKNFSLIINPGETVALVGMTGAGKSTVASLLPRFYEVTGGSILLDGRDIRTITLESLRRHIGIVQQDVFLFSDSVRENISFGRPEATEAEIIAAAKAADAHEFIMKLPDGYDTFIGERGVKLSGGQKQRIAIARVFLKNPPVLILDEATSSLDNETEQRVQLSLMALAENRTNLIIAHRLATIQHADRIVVMTPAGIVESGTHDELMKLKGKYYELYVAQFSEQRLRKEWQEI